MIFFRFLIWDQYVYKYIVIDLKRELTHKGTIKWK